MGNNYKISLQDSKSETREVPFYIPFSSGTYKASFLDSDNSLINAQGNIIVDNTKREYNLSFTLSNGNIINAGNFYTMANIPYVFTVGGAPGGYSLRIQVEAGATGAEIVFAGITKTVSPNTTATISFNSSDTSVTEGEVTITGSKSVSCATYSYEEDGKSYTDYWNGIKNIISFDNYWNFLPTSFARSCALSSVPTMPEDITIINSYAFNGASGISSLRGNQGLLNIENYAFQESDVNLFGLFPSTLQTIGQQSFRDCASLTAISLPDSLQSIGEGAFYNCSSVIILALGDGLEEISQDAFGKCSSLAVINWGTATKILGPYCFEQCISLKTLEIPSTVNTIQRHAFDGCTNLESVTLNIGLSSMGDSIFQECTSLYSINFNGTIAQWNAINKDENWDAGNTTLQYIRCSDGNISI